MRIMMDNVNIRDNIDVVHLPVRDVHTITKNT